MAGDFELSLSVLVEKPGEPAEDSFTGNLVSQPGETISQPVFGWSVVQSVEKPASASGESVGAGSWLLERLELIGPPGVITNQDVIVLPDGSKWALEGNAEDHNNNPWWSPGLVVYYAQRVS